MYYATQAGREAIDPDHGRACSCMQCSVEAEDTHEAYLRRRKVRVEAALAKAVEILSDGPWNRRRKMRVVVEVIETLLGQPDELRMFVKATYSEADGQFVMTWCQDYLERVYGIEVTNVTIGNVIREIKRIAKGAYYGIFRG